MTGIGNASLRCPGQFASEQTQVGMRCFTNIDQLRSMIEHADLLRDVLIYCWCKLLWLGQYVRFEYCSVPCGEFVCM